MSSKVQVASPLPAGAISAWDQPVRHAMRLCIIFAQQLLRFAPKGQYHWDPDEEETDVIVTGHSPLEAEVIYKRPAVVFIRGPIAWANLTLDDLRDFDLHTGKRTHSDLISGTFTLNCLSRVPDVAEDLAWILSSHFWLMKDILLKLGFHTIGKGIQIGTPSPPGAIVSGDTDSSVVDVAATIPFTYQYTASLEPSNLYRLNAVLLETVVEMVQPIQSTDNAVAMGGVGSALAEVNRDRTGQAHPRAVRQRDYKGPIRSLASAGHDEPEEQGLGGTRADPPLTVTIQVDQE